MGILYRQVGDYLLPEIALRHDPQEARPLGGNARMHQAFLREHRAALYTYLLLSERLYPLLREIDEAAMARRALGVSEEVIRDELIFR